MNKDFISFEYSSLRSHFISALEKIRKTKLADYYITCKIGYSENKEVKWTKELMEDDLKYLYNEKDKLYKEYGVVSEFDLLYGNENLKIKKDLTAYRNFKKDVKKYIKYYRKIGIKTYMNKDVLKIKKEFKGSVVALCGQTGAGKSSLLNRIDASLSLKTGEVSLSLGRGKHTTRLVELLEVNQGLIADTPGFSSLEIKIPKNDIKKYYPEFNIQCKYKSCNHIKEDGCKVIELVNKNKIPKWRYDNYLKFLEEVGKEKY